ncbi:hypothetical protein Tco_0401330 [Tanacetum coccineum]
MKLKFLNLFLPRVSNNKPGDSTHSDLEDYEWKMSYEECERIYAEAVIFINKILVRLIDVTVEQWLDLKYRNHETMDENIKKGDIPGFKTYDEFKDEWMKEWNKGIPWVPEEPWSESRIPIDNIHYNCEPFRFKNGKAKWPTYNSNNDGFCNSGELPGMNENESPLNITELDWRNDIHGLYTNANLQATYDPYLVINRIFGRDDRTRNDRDIQDIKEPRNNHDMKGFKSNMERNDTPYYSDEEKEQHNEGRQNEEAEEKSNLKTLLKRKVLAGRQPILFLFYFIESVFPDIDMAFPTPPICRIECLDVI